VEDERGGNEVSEWGGVSGVSGGEWSRVV